MKPDRALVAERPLAQHCAELLRAGPSADDLQPLLTAMGERLSRRLEGAFTPMLGGKEPIVRPTRPREGDLAGLSHSIAALAANSLFGVGHGAAPMLISIEAEPVLRIVDRAFGGKGEAPVPMPKTFPMAADLMIGRLETVIAEHMGAAIAATQMSGRGNGVPTITPMGRDGSLAMLAPFASDLPLTILNIEVDDGGVLPWLMTIAMPIATLAALIGVADAEGASAMTPPARRLPASAMMMAAGQAPFADMTLPLSAVIVDTKVPFSLIARLKVGQILPVTVARSVPLRIGDHDSGQIIAHGTIGAVDEHVAIQITQAHCGPQTPQRKIA